ncbi:hypothetical protein VitviT2T_029049 [Vitis vinifera]|nr:hypothetical protein VitviT2T_029049 [Vitis vinifera]
MVEGSGVTSNTRESIWQQIWTKYGDVTANCSFTAPQFVEIIKGSILQIVELMQKNTACSLSGADTYFIDRALNLSNPYFTHHSDHPGLVLISKSLNGDNYSAWKRAMILALNSKNKLGFVNGSIKAPSEEIDPEGYATWSRCNDMVHSWIVNTLNPEIADSVIYYSTAHEVWEDLCLWDELASYNAASHGAQQDQQKLMQFLMGLNESYSAIHGQILLMNPLPSVRQAYSSVSQEEKQRLLTSTNAAAESAASAAMAVRSNDKSSATWKDGIDRSNTGRMEPTDHPSSSQNFRVNRSSQGQDGRPFFDQDWRRMGSGRGRPQCSYCGDMGHWVQKCFQLHGYPPDHPKARINLGSNSNRNKSFSAANQVSEADEGKPAVALSEAQLKQLLSLLNNQDENSSSKVNAVTKPGSGYEEDDWFGYKPAYRSFVAQHSAVTEPRSYLEAAAHPEWQEAMCSELQALQANDTWFLTPLSAEYLCPHRQDHICPLLACIAAARGWSLHQMDVNNAFLHGNLHEEIYMSPSLGLRRQGEENLVCRLHKSLYGLKQASRQWFAKFSEAIQSVGYAQSRVDYSLFTRKQGKSFTALLIYVDNILITGNDPVSIATTKKFLHSHFHLKDLGDLKYFLGIEVSVSKNGIFISQCKYALEIIEDAGLLGAAPIDTPMERGLKLSDKSDLLKDQGRYRRLVGRLIYLTMSRLDITYAVHVLSWFMHQPRKAHMEAAFRVVRYLKNTPGQGLFFSSNNDFRLRAYCDSNWAGCPLTRRSTVGYCVFLGPLLISWRSKRQKTVSLSSTEAEYRAMTRACCELTWLRYLLKDLVVLHQEPALLYCDNKATLHIAANPVFHERTRHIEMDCHYIRDKIQDGSIITRHVDWLRSPFVGVQPLVEYAQAEGKRDVIRRRLNEKIAEVEQLYLELDQAEASLQECNL